MLDGDEFREKPFFILQKTEHFLETPAFFSKEHFDYTARDGNVNKIVLITFYKFSQDILVSNWIKDQPASVREEIKAEPILSSMEKV